MNAQPVLHLTFELDLHDQKIELVKNSPQGRQGVGILYYRESQNFPFGSLLAPIPSTLLHKELHVTKLLCFSVV